MSEIKTFTFDTEHVGEMNEYHFGINWPVVYVIENKREMYIGETVSAFSRCKQHLENHNRKQLERIHIIADEEYNKSATLDIESTLIQYVAAEGTFELQNGNKGLLNHNYFDRERYQAKFELIWDQLKQLALVKKDLVDIRNSNLFKYSPFKALSQDQVDVADKIIAVLKSNKQATIIVSGRPGTGKTILATYLIKRLREEDWSADFKTALVIPMASLRKTLSKVLSFVKNLNSKMVIGPGNVIGAEYDLLIVDEAHRLHRRRNIVNYSAHDSNNNRLGLGSEGTELDWVLKSSRYQILFYDENQNVRPADVDASDFKKLQAHNFDLKTQMRVEGGDEYIEFVDKVLSNAQAKSYTPVGYDLKLFDSLEDMVNQIHKNETTLKLCRLVAGYAWQWVSKNDGSRYDIEIGGVRLRWNSVNEDWVNSPNAAKEVGCIHTVQGYDLNYAGVIIGPEIIFDERTQKIRVIRENYKDRNGHAGVEHEEELEKYVINIYKTLLTRGIKGTYIYVVDLALRRKISALINS